MPGDKAENRQDIYHHYDNDGVRVNVSVEKNSKGYNWSVTVVGAKTVKEAMAVLKEAEAEMLKTYGTPVKE